MRPRLDIAIVGAGFSGSLLALQILRTNADARVHLIEQAAKFGRGLAYGAADADHLLNVRAANMSAVPDAPGHFLDWLRLVAPDRAVAPSFVSRQLYGTYLQALLAATVQTDRGAGRLIAVGDEAVGIRFDGARPRLRLALGHELEADTIVLATGNLPPYDLPCLVGIDPAIYARDPWAPDAFADLGANDDVLLVGTGLTAIDMILRLRSRGHVGRIHALSRRGLRPRAHEARPISGCWSVPSRPTLTQLLRAARKTAAEMGWRDAIDGMRPSVQRLWREASIEQRRRFLRHLRPWWDVHRHRIAPEVAATVAAKEREGGLRFLAGRIEEVDVDGCDAIVTWRPRGGARKQELRVQRIVNCTGPAGDPSRSRSPLIRDLIDRGSARADACGLGLDVDEHCRLLDDNGVAQDRLLAIGPMSRGAFWEIIAVPDIRIQAAQIARRLATA